LSDNPYRLPRHVVPTHYDLRLEPDLETLKFDGSVEVTIEVTQPVEEVVLNAAEVTVTKASVATAGGEILAATVSYDEAAERVTLALEATLGPGIHRLLIEHTGIINDQLRGLYKSVYVDAEGDEHLIATYFEGLPEALGIDLEIFKSLGSSPGNQGGFNMTALALRGSRFHNGVSRIHGEVASRMEGYVWPQVPPEENPIRHVTNGVHVPTFLAREWAGLLDMRLGTEWRNELLNTRFWEQVQQIPDHNFWSLRQSLKAELLEEVRRRVVRQHRRNGLSPTQIERLTRLLHGQHMDILTIGFARRFATYKRATLLFSDPERLARLLGDPERPVLIIFAGKAHPNDLPGQHLIQAIHDFSRRPEFEGRIVLLEGYDLALARKLVTGVDVWLNTPEHPLEASGTSGQKAGLNGVINLSVLDGWWGEGYTGDNGWAITPHGPEFDAAFRNQEEGRELLDILEHQVIPLYFERNSHGYPARWVQLSKRSMISILPRFNAQRMVMDYVRDFYGPARDQGRRLSADALR